MLLFIECNLAVQIWQTTRLQIKFKLLWPRLQNSLTDKGAEYRPLAFKYIIYLFINKYVYIYFFAVALLVMASSFLRFSRSHTTTHHSRQDSSGRVISSSQRPPLYNTQHSQQTNIHALGGIRTHDLSRRAAAELRLRPHGYWNRLKMHISGK